MAISMVRKPSETPNITNIDDIIPFRYAYGNQSGYVISRGAEVSHTVNGIQFTINSGRLVIQGVECDIDSNGITLTIDSVSETRYYAVYLEINLATYTSNIKVEFDTATYPNITEGDDLTANSSGIARLVLYNFIAQNGVISGVEKKVKAIDYTGTALVGYDTSKGTVEERLTKLGFSEDDIIDLDNNVVGKVSRQGNYVIGELYSNFNQNRFGVLPEKYRPKGKIEFGCKSKIYVFGYGYTELYSGFSGSNTGGSTLYYTFKEDGDITLTGESVSFTETMGNNARVTGTAYATGLSNCNFGYEANPL